MASSIQRGARQRAGHDPRTAALRAIDRILSGNDASQAVLDAELAASNMVPCDKGLTTELVYGYLRQAIRVRHGLLRYLRKPDKLPPEMLLTCSLAAFELAHLDRVPGHASVNWAVGRIRNRFGQGLAGVANGALRAFARELPRYRGSSAWENEIPDPVHRAAIQHGLPEWIGEIWSRDYGPERMQAFFQASSQRPLTAVRINRSRPGWQEVRASLLNVDGAQAVGDAGVVFSAKLPYQARQLAAQGALSLQSPAVMEAVAALELDTLQGPVWDACAGRGGKSAAMLEAGVDVRLVSDTAAGRLGAVATEFARLGLSVPETLDWDAAELLPEEKGQFAGVLADVPCTGLGTLSRRPEIRFRRSREDVASNAALQARILDALCQRVAPGGSLVYMTCTLAKAENEDAVAAFLVRNPDFHLKKEWQTADDAPWNEFLYGAVLRRR